MLLQKLKEKKQEAFNDLKNQIADISVQVAEKIIRQKLDGNIQSDLIDSYIKDIKKN